MTKKKKTFRKFINEEILKIEPPKKGKEFGSFKEFVNDVKGYQPPEKPELQTETFKEFVDKTKGPEKNFVPDYINPTQKQIEEINKRRIIEEINEVLKYRDPVLNKMSFQEWLKIPQNFFVFELSNEQAKRLYEQDMSRVEKYEEINKKSGKGRNKVAVTAAEEEPSFDPKTIASLVAWFDAADTSSITLNGDLVSQWDDKSGNGNHAAQSTESKQPKYNTSGGSIGQAHIQFGHNEPDHNALTIAGPTTWAAVSAGGVWNMSIFAVLHQPWPPPAGPAYTNVLLFNNSRTVGIFQGRGITMYIGGWGPSGGTAEDSLPSEFLAGWLASDSQFITRLNGSVDDATSRGAGGSALTNSNWHIGRDAAGARVFEVSEILIFNTELTGSDLSDVENYLNTKWSIY